MGVSGATPHLREELLPIAERVDTIEAHLAERSPDETNTAFIVDCGRFAHAAVSRHSRQEDTLTLVELSQNIAADITGRCLFNDEAQLFLTIDDYTRDNVWKSHTVSARAKAVGAIFMVNQTEFANPRLDPSKLAGIYGSRQSRLAFYTAVKDTLTWGHTAFTDRAHCISLDPTETQRLVQRYAYAHMGFPQLDFGVDVPVDLTGILASIRSVAGETAAFLPRHMTLFAEVDAVSQTVLLAMTINGVTECTRVEAHVDPLQWIPFKFFLFECTLVVNVTSLGEFVEDEHGNTLVSFAPTVCFDLFRHLPCPQLVTQPIESDFSSVEFAAALSMIPGFKTVIRCAEDSDWTLYALPLQKAVNDRGLDVEIISHVCPSQRGSVPDMWIDNRRALQLPGMRVALLWYLVAPHDYSTGIASVGAKGRLKIMDAWKASVSKLPFTTNAENPSEMAIDKKMCLRIAQSTLKPDVSLACKLLDADKAQMTEKNWLAGAIHPLRVVANALWPLNETPPW
jgi:hypothetical protein